MLSSPFYNCGRNLRGEETGPGYPRGWALLSSQARGCPVPGSAKSTNPCREEILQAWMKLLKNGASFTQFQILDQVCLLEPGPK